MKNSKKGSSVVIFLLILVIIGLLTIIGLNYFKIINFSKVEELEIEEIDNQNEDVVIKLSEEEAWSLGKGLYDKATEIYETWIFRPYCYNKDMKVDEFVTFPDKNGYSLNYYKTEFSSLDELKISLNNWLSVEIINAKITEEDAFKDLSNLEIYTNYIESDGYLYCRMDIGKGWMSMYLDDYALEVKDIDVNKITYNVKSSYAKYEVATDGNSSCKWPNLNVNNCSFDEREYKDTNFVIEKNDNNNWVVSEYTLHN